MNPLFPYAHIVAGVLVLIVGFVFHWVGQLISLINWGYATKIGLQEEGLLDEYAVYERAIAVSDVALGWVYGLAGIGLILGARWGYKLAWFPGVVLLYHAIGFWFWTGNRRKAGHPLTPTPVRIGWTIANGLTGVLAIWVAWPAH